MSENPFVILAKEIKKIADEKRHVFATVSSVSSSGVSIKIDGDNTGSTKNYTCNTDVHFTVGDRVIASKDSGTYVIICKIGKPGGPIPKTTEMTQAVGVDSDGKLWTTPPKTETPKVSSVYSAGSTTNYISLTNDNVFLPSDEGFSLGSMVTPFSELYVGEGNYYWSITSEGIIPSRKIAAFFNIGSSLYPIYQLHAQSIYLNGKQLTGGADPDMSDQLVKMGGNTLYYIQATTARELIPNSVSTTYPFYLGTSTYYWHYAYIGSNTVKIGSTASSKLAFFAGTPIARQTLSTNSNNMSYTSVTESNYLYVLNNLVGILKNKYGLIG